MLDQTSRSFLDLNANILRASVSKLSSEEREILNRK